MHVTTAQKPASTTRRVWQLAWPNILANLLFTTVGFLHIKIVAELGTTSVAAVTTGHRVFFLLQAILMGVSVAATAMIARFWGAQEVRQAEMVGWTSMMMSVALAAVLSIPVLLAPEWIAGLFGLDPETTRLAATFIFWLGVFYVFTAISMMLATALRATGDVITPLWFLLASSTLNVILAYHLAFGIGPFPQLGVAGVAFGGSAGASVVTMTFFAFWWRGKFNLKPIRRLAVDWQVARQMASIGAPAILEQGIIQLSFLGFFAIVAQYGTVAFAAYGIGMSLVSFSIVIGFGFGIATATLAGQQLGAGDREAAVRVVGRALAMAVLIMAVLSAIVAWAAEDLALFMIDDPEVITLTVAFIYFIAIGQPIMAVEFTLGGAFRGSGDTRFPLVATFCGIIFGRLLPALLFLKLGLSIYWIFSVMLMDYTLKAILLLYRFRSRKWLDVKIEHAPAPAGTNFIDSDKKNT